MTFKTIVNKLKKNDIYSDYEKIEKDLYLINVHPWMSIIFNDKYQEIFVNFDVSVKPDISAELILMLKNVKGLKGIHIGDSFTVINKKYLEGDEAIKKLEEIKRKEIIKEYIKEKLEDGMMRSNFMYEC